MSVQSLVNLLKSRWWVLLLVPLGAGAVAWKLSGTQPVAYTANATLLIDYRMPLEGELAGIILPVGLQESYVATQLEIVKSRRVAAQAAALLGQRWIAAAFPDIAATASGEEAAVDALLEGLTLTIGKDSRIVNLWYSHPDPVAASQAANAFAGAYREINKALGQSPALESARAVETSLEGVRAKLEAAERKLSDYQQRTGIVDTNEQLDIHTAHLKDLATQRLEAEAGERRAESRVAALEQALAQGKSPDALPELLGSELVQRIHFEIVRKESEAAERSVTLGARHPDLLRLRADLKALEGRLATEIDKVLDGIRIELAEARGLAESARAAEAAQKAKVLELKSVRDGLAPLLREVEGARASYDRSLRMYSEYVMHGGLDRTNVEILDRARPPLLPSSLDRVTRVLLALGGGLVLALTLVLGWELADRRIRSRSDLEKASAVPVLGVLPHA